MFVHINEDMSLFKRCKPKGRKIFFQEERINRKILKPEVSTWRCISVLNVR